MSDQMMDMAAMLDVSEADDICAVAARTDVNIFAEYVMRDEETHVPIEQADVHMAWQEQADLHDRLILWGSVESGKSFQMSITRVLWEIGNNPTLRVAIVCATQGMAKKFLKIITSYIENSQELRKVFPDLKRATPWTETQITVERPTIAKDPTIQVCGVHGNIVGSRLDLLVMDDVLNYENCRTPTGREDLYAWYKATLVGRMTQRSRVRFIGTAYHPEDIMHRLAKETGGYVALRYPLIDSEGNLQWPDKWPMERLQKQRDSMGSVEFARQVLCLSRDDSTSRFKQDSFKKCMERGEGRDMVYSLQVIPPGYKVYTGVDLAVSRKDSADDTCLFTIAVHPNGDREVLSCESGKWSAQEIIARVIDAHKRYQSICIVENNSAQDFLVQLIKGKSAIPIRPFTTGRNKAHPEFGVEAMSAEFEANKWIIPNRGGKCHDELEAWIGEMLYYDPKGHTGDKLMASWFAREGARMGSIKVEHGRFDMMSR